MFMKDLAKNANPSQNVHERFNWLKMSIQAKMFMNDIAG